MPSPIIYTIGHSTHSQLYFLQLLQMHQITALVDVRSIPASAYNPQYNQSPFASFLKKNGIDYLHFAQPFGARQVSPDCLNDQGQVDFEKVRQSTHFLKGVDRLQKGIDKGHTIALMCAEAEPCQCHRFGMISPALSSKGMEVRHILKDKTCVSQQTIERQLLNKYNAKVADTPLFAPLPAEEKLIHAYTQLNREIGYIWKL